MNNSNLFLKKIQNLSSDDLIDLKNIELLENKYLEKYYYFLKFAENEILEGLKTKDYIRDNWIDKWGTDKASRSDFDVGAERIVYALLNGKGIGSPNSCPVGSDLMFEVDDAFIHIDMKTVCTDNIRDCKNSIFVGENQNSYCGIIEKNNESTENYIPSLPTVYTVNRKEYKSPIPKVCLSYFIIILYDKTSLDTEFIMITCMPNGKLEKVYGSKVLAAGKNPGKARYKFSAIPNFELLNQKLRTRVVYLNENVRERYASELKNIISFYDNPFNR